MLDFTRALTPPSAARYLFWKARRRPGTIALRLRSGIRFFLRSDQSDNRDYGVAYEVFIDDDYHLPQQVDPAAIRNVVDIGGNVGFSTLHWLTVFPACNVEVFEPHPLHVEQLRKNLALNGVGGRVTVHDKAAGASGRPVSISRQGASSSTLGDTQHGLPTEMVDLFETLRGRRIDLMKIDAEGGEYELLGDDRFAGLKVGCIIMEWHSRGNGPADRVWCEQRLTGMGYVLHTVSTFDDHGLIWAFRP